MRKELEKSYNPSEIEKPHYQKCKKVVIESESTIGVCGDGEVSPTNKVVVEVIPDAIAFSIPKDSGCESIHVSNTEE